MVLFFYLFFPQYYMNKILKSTTKRNIYFNTALKFGFLLLGFSLELFDHNREIHKTVFDFGNSYISLTSCRLCKPQVVSM